MKDIVAPFRTLGLMLKVGLIWILMLGFLSAEYLHRSNLPWGFLNRAHTGLLDAFQAPDWQWLVLSCCTAYTAWLFRALNSVSHPWPEASLSLGLFAIGALTCALNYDQASKSTDALLLCFEIALVFGLRFWRAVEVRSRQPLDISRMILVVSLILFSSAVVWHPGPGPKFEYRAGTRWNGLWDNPNTFGILTGCGAALAVGTLARIFEFGVSGLKLAQVRFESRSWKSEVVGWMKVVFLIVVAGVMLFGLVKSYSRGAWLAFVVGTVFLGYQLFRFSDYQVFRLSNFNSFFRRWVPLMCILISIGVLAFWKFRHTEQLTTRRALSVANVNDFSWRRRIAAYEGALQMIADKPGFGFGWNIPDPVYDKFYRKPKVDEGMAIQMNDFFMLGATLGIPALGCFLAYIWLSLTRNGERGVRKEIMEHRTSNIEHPTSKWEKFSVFSVQCSEEEWLRMTCRAGAIVLLVGFFFDGGLFKLATGATFWILIELGSASGVQGSRSKVQSSGSAEALA